MKKTDLKQSKQLLYWLLLNIGIGIFISLLPFFMPVSQLENAVTMLTGVTNEPLNFFSLIAVLLIIWRIVIILKFSKIHQTRKWLIGILLVISPFNFGLPILIVYMLVTLWQHNKQQRLIF